MLYKSIKLSTISIALASVLTACGGGGSSSSFQGKAFDGVAVDFYIAGAKVNFDDCNTSVTTDAAGKFNFTTTENCQESSITVTGGTDIVTGLPFTGTLKSKKVNLQNLNNNSATPEIVLSPLTTLEYEAVAAGINLDTLLDKLDLASLKGKDLTSFDPQTSATAAEMAKIFVVQQLANKLQEAGSSDNGFTQIVQALNNSTENLFTENGLNLEAISTLVDASTAANLATVYTALNTAIAEGGENTNLADLITNDASIKDIITENLLTVGYSDILVAGKTIAELKASSATSPINLELASLNTLLNVSFKASSAETTTDSIQIAFKLNGTQGSQTETLNVLVEKVNLTFNAGELASAVIPAGTKVSIASSLYNVESVAFTVDNDVALGKTIDLNSLVESHNTLKGYYDRFSTLLNVGATVEAEAFIKSEKFTTVTAGLNAAQTVTVGGSSFSGENLKANFKLN